MKLDFGRGYSIEIDEQTFAFAIYRGDVVVLRHRPCGEVLQPILVERGRVQASIGRSWLMLELGDDTVSLRWSSPDAITSAIALDGNWYGQGELINQLWPLNRIMLQEDEFTTRDNGATGLSCILAPIWLSDRGAAIYAHSVQRVSLNAPPEHYPRFTWSLGAEQVPFSQRPFADSGTVGDGLLRLIGDNLNYEILLAENAVEVHRRVVDRIGHLSETPPLAEIANPIWNTWARYHATINQDKVLTYAREIVEHDYPRGRFVIDDRWQVHYGDLAFDPIRFPDAHGMIDALHGLGFSVHTWVVPFMSPESEAFREGAENGYLIRQADGSPYIVTWWQGLGGLLDVTNPAALAWFRGNLQQLQAFTGLDGFKFDAGEASFLPADAVLFEPVSTNEFTHRYIEFVGAHFAWSDVRSGWLNQRCPVLPRQWDKASTWGLDNGLHSVITGGLSLSLIGYSLFLPDMIGGNAYTEQPDTELMIRWAQVNALMPGMQFSLAPWDYGEECDRLCRKAAELHQSFAPMLAEVAARHAQTGEPIIRPLWWIAPDDPAALTCDDEFLVGERYLIAPVIKAGARSRDIYLPAGSWREVGGDTLYAGSSWLRDFDAPLDKLPLFERS